MTNDEQWRTYRKEHPRCRYCKYHKFIVRQAGFEEFFYHKCELKDKYISMYCPSFRGFLCRWYSEEIE